MHRPQPLLPIDLLSFGIGDTKFLIRKFGKGFWLPVTAPRDTGVSRRSGGNTHHVQAAAGDAGGAIGSALAAHRKLGGKRSFLMDHAYWGPQFSEEEIARVIGENRKSIREAGCLLETDLNELELCQRAAASIADGKVVGWFQGRMEWGAKSSRQSFDFGRPSSRRYEGNP